VVHNTALNTSDNHHSSDDVYWRGRSEDAQDNND